ncbi:hypothetical protein [Weissella oryzae]|nr:hypothetical protein [Weissella oryzae]
MEQWQQVAKAETHRSEETTILNVEKSSNLFGTSVAYIVKNPVGTGNISVDEHGSFARYNKGDKIKIEINKYKNLDDDIELVN